MTSTTVLFGGDRFYKLTSLNELIIDDVCSNGSLGCLAYNGGPSLQCCSVNDKDRVILPFIRFDPDIDNEFPSPDNPLCKCLRCFKPFNIDDVLKEQVYQLNCGEYFFLFSCHCVY